MKKGLLGGSLQAVTKGADQGGPDNHGAHIGLDLSRKRLDFDLLCEDGSRIERGAAPPDAERATQYGDIDEARAAAERLAESRG